MSRKDGNRKSSPDAFADIYRQAQGQAAGRAKYDVEAGLERLNAWMDREETDGQAAEGVSPVGQGSLFGWMDREEPARQPADDPSLAEPGSALAAKEPDASANTGDDRAHDRAHDRGLLFEQPELIADSAGYRGPTACAAAGITYRQLDYWARTGLVEPSVRAAGGSGSQRLYGFRDILVLKVVKGLLDSGISLQQIRTAVSHLRERADSDLAQVTLMSDGVSVYACTSPDEVVDLLQGGQGVFGIALGRVWQEVEGTLSVLASETPDDSAHGAVSARRRRRESETVVTKRTASSA